MQTLDRLGADDLVAVVTTYRDLLRSHRDRINLLNVYPVPDGDTGTNMALTLDAVVVEIDREAPPGADGARNLDAVARAIAHGSLMGARGNSGVILSQILRGLAGAFTSSVPGGVREGGPVDGGAVDGTVLAEGLRRACEGAYQAVGNPVEGTILTVVRAASVGATEAISHLASASGAMPDSAPRPEAGHGVIEVLEAARDAAAVALEQTTDMLPALKAAGVVDSGGSGLLLLFDAALHVADGRPLPESAVDPSVGSAADQGVAQGPVDPLGALRYEVMYLLEAPDTAIAGFRQVWAGVGDSIVVVGGDGIYNCHIHTDDIGAAIEAALDVGRPRQIRVSDLWDQVEEERWVRDAGLGSVGLGSVIEDRVEPVACAVVAVCNGDGVRRIFGSLGVSRTVAGGQSMNPSTADILTAIESAPSDAVVVLPNNKNIVPVARAAAAQAAKDVRVVPTAGIPEGFAALLEYDPEGDAASNAEAMAASAARVVAGEVTVAVRDSDSPAGPIREGDWLGLSRSGIEAVAPSPAEAAIALLAKLINEAHHEMATIITGEGAQAAETRRVTEWLAGEWPHVGVEVHHGGQPLYPYLFSIE